MSFPKRSESVVFAEKSKKGVTLLEITIVMAVLAIISVMVISLCSHISGVVAKNSKAYDEMRELTHGRRLVEYWIAYYDNDEYEINISDGAISATNGVDVYTIYLDSANEVLVGEYPNDRLEKCPYKYFTDIRFSRYESEKLYRCAILYDEDSEFGFIVKERA